MRWIILMLLVTASPAYSQGPVKTGGTVTASNKQPGIQQVYIQAITDFIVAAEKSNKQKFDTLIFLKRKNGQADDFPDITLPTTIQNTPIKLASPESTANKSVTNRQGNYINLVGWSDNNSAEFIFVVFSNDFKHLYDYYLTYKVDWGKETSRLEKINRKGPPFDR